MVGEKKVDADEVLKLIGGCSCYVDYCIVNSDEGKYIRLIFLFIDNFPTHHHFPFFFSLPFFFITKKKQ
jgi:hypothetical protein